MGQMIHCPQTVRFVLKAATQLSRVRLPIQSIRGAHSHGTRRGNPSFPQSFSRSWSFTAFGVGVTGLGFSLWQLSQSNSSQVPPAAAQYADEEVMLKVWLTMYMMTQGSDCILPRLLGFSRNLRCTWPRVSDNR